MVHNNKIFKNKDSIEEQSPAGSRSAPSSLLLLGPFLPPSSFREIQGFSSSALLSCFFLSCKYSILQIWKQGKMENPPCALLSESHDKSWWSRLADPERPSQGFCALEVTRGLASSWSWQMSPRGVHLGYRGGARRYRNCDI